MARMTRVPLARRVWIADTGTPAAMEITSASGEIVPADLVEHAAHDLRLDRQHHDLRRRRHVIVGRGIDAVLLAQLLHPLQPRPRSRHCAAAKSSPRNNPRNMASAILPAPTKPMVRVIGHSTLKGTCLSISRSPGSCFAQRPRRFRDRCGRSHGPAGDAFRSSRSNRTAETLYAPRPTTVQPPRRSRSSSESRHQSSFIRNELLEGRPLNVRQSSRSIRHIGEVAEIALRQRQGAPPNSK